MKSFRGMFTARRQVAAAMVLAAGAVGGVTLSAGGGVAGASGTANLSVTQAVSNGTGSGNTIVTDSIHNSGPSTATNVVETALLKVNGGSVSYLTGNAQCEQLPAPSGWTFMFDCQLASLASGHTWSPKFSLTSTNGAPFTRFVSVGEGGPGDPSLANNASTMNSYFGSRADLALSQAATAGASAGKVTVTDSVVNHGPWTASNLQNVIEINSPAFSGVLAASNISAACQFIPPASGYNAAVSCTTASLAPGKTWTLTFSYSGGAGASLVQKGSVTALSPADPATANNTATTTTSYHA